MTKNHRHELTLSADQNLVLAFHQRHHPLLNMLRSAPLIGSTLTQSELDALPDLLCDYLDERDETWVSFAKRSGCPQDALVGLLLRAEPLQPKRMSKAVTTVGRISFAIGCSLIACRNRRSLSSPTWPTKRC